MKNVIIIIAILSTLGIFLRISQATEEKQVIVIEMGESGQTVEFPMSPEEIATEDADNARLVALRKTRFNKSKKPVVSFEMAESGIIIEFPVTAPEISGKNQHR